LIELSLYSTAEGLRRAGATLSEFLKQFSLMKLTLFERDLSEAAAAQVDRGGTLKNDSIHLATTAERGLIHRPKPRSRKLACLPRSEGVVAKARVEHVLIPRGFASYAKKTEFLGVHIFDAAHQPAKGSSQDILPEAAGDALDLPDIG
jgi:hypothetical protein